MMCVLGDHKYLEKTPLLLKKNLLSIYRLMKIITTGTVPEFSYCSLPFLCHHLQDPKRSKFEMIE